MVGDNPGIAEGGFFGLADESGSGKIVFAHSILSLLPENDRVACKGKKFTAYGIDFVNPDNKDDQILAIRGLPGQFDSPEAKTCGLNISGEREAVIGPGS